MKTLTNLKMLVLMLFVVIIASCERSEEILVTEEITSIEVEQLEAIDKRKMVFELINLLNDPIFKTKIIKELQEDRTPGINLKSLLERNPEVSSKASYKYLISTASLATQKAKSNMLADAIEIPELWLQIPTDGVVDFSEILVTYAPEGDEKNWKEIVAYDLSKNEVPLSVTDIPDVPVIVLETKGYETMKIEVDHMNRQFREMGVQNNRFQKSNMDLNPISKANSSLPVTKLTKIRLKNDHEPWTSGAAEVYAITSGIRSSGNKAEIKVIPMYYLNYEDKNYYPNQIMLFWDDYKYTAANIQYWEKDDNTNYQTKAVKIAKKVNEKLSGTSYAYIGEIAQIILEALPGSVEALPGSVFTNDDDYVDSFYTIRKYKNYTNYYGARSNAKVNLRYTSISSN